MNKIYFSIIITSFNKGKYIERCIKSCLSQKERDFEVILADNMSTDNTEDILSRYSDSLKIIKKERISNYPIINQIDLTIEAFNISKGEVICLLDGDDFFSDNKLQCLKEKYAQYDKEVIFDLPVLILQKDEKKLFKLKRKYQKNIWPTIIPTSSISMKREFFSKCLYENIFSLQYSLLAIDFRINVYSRIFRKENFLILEESYNYHCHAEDSISSKLKKTGGLWWITRLEAHRFMKNLYKRENLNYKNYFDYFSSYLISKIFKAQDDLRSRLRIDCSK